MTGGDSPKPYYRFRAGYKAYEPEYNPRVHGPYYPHKYYGTAPRASIWELRIGHLWSHFLQSNKSLANMKSISLKCVNRIIHNKFSPLHCGIRGFYQLWMIPGLFLMLFKYGDLAAERRVKYHW